MAAMDFPPTPTVGQLYPDPPTVGVPQYRWDGGAWLAVSTPEDLSYVRRTGDTMSGLLTLSGEPTVDLHAATKLYVDAGVGGVGGGLAAKVAKAGDTMTGPLVLPGDATLALQAVPKQQLDAVAADALAYSGMQVNGGFSVSQELGAAGTTVAGGYFCDGWRMTKIGTMAITASATAVPGSVSGLSHAGICQATTAQASIGAGDVSLIYQAIEGYRVARLGWGAANAMPITIAFWSSHNPAGLYSVVIRNGANNRAYGAGYTHAVADVPQYNVITIPGDITGTWLTDNGIGMQIFFAQACGATFIVPAANTWTAGIYSAVPGQVNGVAVVNNLMRILGVTILPGIYAPTAAQSPLIMRPFDQELATCQRYFVKMGGYAHWASPGGGYGFNCRIGFPVEMRAVPTCSRATVSTSNLTSTSDNYITVYHDDVYTTATTTGTVVYQFTLTADARL